jgi:hypothetical protein
MLLAAAAGLAALAALSLSCRAAAAGAGSQAPSVAQVATARELQAALLTVNETHIEVTQHLDLSDLLEASPQRRVFADLAGRFALRSLVVRAASVLLSWSQLRGSTSPTSLHCC